jgi:rhodanese-related sulfurtransferase
VNALPCALRGFYPQVPEVTVEELKQKQVANPGGTVLVDCRNPKEQEVRSWLES